MMEAGAAAPGAASSSSSVAPRAATAEPAAAAEARRAAGEGWFQLGRVRTAQGQLSAAVDAWHAASRCAPQRRDVLLCLGAVHARRGDLGAAAALYAEALQRRADDAETLYNLGTVLLGLGQRTKAVTHFQRACLLRPTEGFAEAEGALRAMGEQVPARTVAAAPPKRGKAPPKGARSMAMPQ